MASLGAEALQKAKSEDKPIFLSIPEVQSALITSAMKNVDVAVYNYLKTVADGSVKAGISTATLQNGGVDLARSMVVTARSRPI